MIIEFSIENFRSIKDRLTLSMDSGPGKKLPQNLIAIDEKQTLIKSAAIYGPNASGKSNLIKGLFFMWYMVTQSHKFNTDVKLNQIPIPRNSFRLDKTSMKKPSRFEIIFIQDKVKYRYGFSCDDEKIIDEYLYYSPKGREAVIFNRTNTTNFEFTIDRKEQEIRASQTLKNTLYLSRATQLGYEKTKVPYEFFAGYIVINYAPNWEEITTKELYSNPKLKEKIISIMKKVDFGGLEDIVVSKEKGKIREIAVKLDWSEVKQKDSEGDIYKLKFLHKTDSGELVEFNRSDESEGTIKALSILGPYFEIMDKGKVLVMDEFETSLHPNIVKFLVALFNSRKYNKSGAQLIFTTHNTSLLDSEIFRKDQIYICSKESNGSTKLNSLLDFNIKQESDFERAYLSGRFGGLPFIDETLLE